MSRASPIKRTTKLMNNSPLSPLISPLLVETFQRDGVVCIRQAFSPSWISVLERGMAANLKTPGPWACHYTPENQPGGFYDDYCNWERIPEYQEFLFQSPAARVAGELLDSENARLFHEHILIKESGTRETTPWHHDLPYYCLDGNQLCSIWTPLDPVPESSALQFVAGSHRWKGLFLPRKFSSHQDYGYDSQSFRPVPDIDAETSQHQLLRWSMEPGDCIVFHMKTLHGGPGTMESTHNRRAFSSRWLGDDAVFAKRPGETSPPFPKLIFKSGDPVDGDLFPVCWRADVSSS